LEINVWCWYLNLYICFLNEISYLREKKKFNLLIHFAFGKYRDNPEIQLKKVLNDILKKKCLLFGKNPEFIPRLLPQYHPKFNGAKIYQIPIEIMNKGPNYIDINATKQSNLSKNHFNYIREDVKMICFIDISVNNIVNSIHIKQYGRFGIVFRNTFLYKKGIKKVHYFKESELFCDDKVLKWNFQYAYRSNLNSQELIDKRELEIEILAYRKPAKMFSSFINLRRLNLKAMEVENVYDRYCIGYNFKKEREWRIVSSEDTYLDFSESDLSLIFVPNNKIQRKLIQYFKTNWSIIPKVEICPQLISK